MKAIKTLAKTGILIASLILASCNHDDDNNSGGGTLPSGSYIHAKVDGSSWSNLEVSGVTTVVATKTGTGESMAMLINGADSAGNSMAISTYGITAVGTYDISPDTNNFLAYVTSSPMESYDTGDCSGASGTLTITVLTDTKVEGTFSFTGKSEDCGSSKTVTNGSFRGVF